MAPAEPGRLAGSTLGGRPAVEEKLLELFHLVFATSDHLGSFDSQKLM